MSITSCARGLALDLWAGPLTSTSVLGIGMIAVTSIRSEWIIYEDVTAYESYMCTVRTMTMSLIIPRLHIVCRLVARLASFGSLRCRRFYFGSDQLSYSSRPHRPA